MRRMRVTFTYAELRRYTLQPSVAASADIKSRVIAGDGTTCASTGEAHHCHPLFLQDVYFIIKMALMLSTDWIVARIRGLRSG